MSPVTHLLASWLIAAKTTRHPRDCRLVTLAGILPDLDGLGLVVDIACEQAGLPVYDLYGNYHHVLLHGIAGATAIALALAAFATDRWRVLRLALLVIHLHLVCDLVGSRGPTPQDVWPIPYLGPFSQAWELSWAGQWPLHGWLNRLLSVVLLAFSLWLPTRLGHSVVGVFNRRADAAVVSVLQTWRHRIAPPSPRPDGG